MARRSHMVHQFSQVPSAQIPRSSFQRNHSHKTTFNSGELIPVFVDEALPGDTFNCRMHAFARLSTPKTPVMDNLRATSFFFAVPVRLLWDNWQRFNGEQDNPSDTTDYLVPQMTAPSGGYGEQTIHDYFGLPTKVAGYSHSALWHRAYNLIIKEWFRDENLQDSPVINKGDGPDDPADYKIVRRGKRHDYFTSSLPWPQKGPAVPLPLTGNAPVRADGPAGDNTAHLTAFSSTAGEERKLRADAANVYFWSSGGGYPLEADLSKVTATTINELRQAWQIQKLYERDARGGTRYTEIVRSHFGVVSPDARLQRPEYLGGGSNPVVINPIAQTSETTAESPQANLAAVGTLNMRGHGFTKSFTEHCILIGLVSIQADLTYQQGLNRMFSRRGRFDFYWPALSHIGEQAVLNKEIYLDGTPDDEEVWGYQERYAEYRYKPSQITGQFRSNAQQPLDIWHLSQDFQTRPALNDSFIQDTPPVKRVIAVQGDFPEFIWDSYFALQCARPMPLYSVPGLVDHF